jgi:hypothetical protein
MADISKLSRLVSGVHRDVDLTANTLVLQNLKLNLGGANNVTFAGTLTANRTITVPDSNINLGHITNLQNLSGVAPAANDLGTFTGNTIPDSSTIKQALQSLETAVENISVSPDFLDNVFRISDDVDNTKKIAFQASGIATGTTRTITMPDANVNLGEVNTAILQNGSRAFTADQSMGGFKLTNLAAPTAGSDAATKTYVDNAIEGVKPKEAVRVATTANITLSGLQTIDGVSLVAGDRVLVKDQTSAADNGIYVVAAGAWSRATDFDQITPINEIKGAYVAVTSGNTHAGKVFVCNSDPATLGTDPITFVFFNSITTLNGGDGISIVGTTIEVDHDGQGLQFVSGQLSLELDGSTLSKSAAGLKVADAGITATQLATNSVITAKIQDGAVTEAKLAASVAGNGLTGGAGTPLAVGANADGSIQVNANDIAVNSAPLARRTMVAGEAFAANTTWLVRLARSGETAGRIYKADKDASSNDNFYVIGVAFSSTAVAAGDNITVIMLGEHTLQTSDANFAAADIGKPVFLTSSGAFSVTAPTANNDAVVRIGMVQDTNKLWVQPEVVGVL